MASSPTRHPALALQKLKPAYAEAATALKDKEAPAILGKVRLGPVDAGRAGRAGRTLVLRLCDQPWQRERGGKSAASPDSPAMHPPCAQVDATEQGDLASKFGIQGYPTLKWFVDGELVGDYSGGRTQ